MPRRIPIALKAKIQSVKSSSIKHSDICETLSYTIRGIGVAKSLKLTSNFAFTHTGQLLFLQFDRLVALLRSLQTLKSEWCARRDSNPEPSDP